LSGATRFKKSGLAVLGGFLIVLTVCFGGGALAVPSAASVAVMVVLSAGSGAGAVWALRASLPYVPPAATLNTRHRHPARPRAVAHDREDRGGEASNRLSPRLVAERTAESSRWTGERTSEALGATRAEPFAHPGGSAPSSSLKDSMLDGTPRSVTYNALSTYMRLLPANWVLAAFSHRPKWRGERSAGIALGREGAGATWVVPPRL